MLAWCSDQGAAQLQQTRRLRLPEGVLVRRKKDSPCSLAPAWAAWRQQDRILKDEELACFGCHSPFVQFRSTQLIF